MSDDRSTLFDVSVSTDSRGVDVQTLDSMIARFESVTCSPRRTVDRCLCFSDQTWVKSLDCLSCQRIWVQYDGPLLLLFSLRKIAVHMATILFKAQWLVTSRYGLWVLSPVLMLSLALFTPVTAAARARPKRDSSATRVAKTQAKKLFVEGVKLFDEGYYPQAIAKFQTALRLFRNPRIHARIALCYKWIGNNLKALHHYERFLAEFRPRTGNRKDHLIRKRIEVEVRNLLKLVARIRVRMQTPAGAEVQIDGRIIGRAPLEREIRHNPGSVTVTAGAKGFYPFRRVLRLTVGATTTVRISLIKIKPGVRIVTRPSTPVYRRWWFWTVVGFGVAAAATATTLGVYYGIPGETRQPMGVPVFLDQGRTR